MRLKFKKFTINKSKNNLEIAKENQGLRIRIIKKVLYSVAYGLKRILA